MLAPLVSAIDGSFTVERDIPDQIELTGIKYNLTTHQPGLLRVYSPEKFSLLQTNFDPSIVTQNSSFVINPSRPQYSRFKRVTHAEAIRTKFNSIPDEFCDELSQLISDLCKVYAFEASWKHRVEVNINKSPPQRPHERYPGEGIHYDNRDFRLYYSIGSGFEWVKPELINPESMRKISKGRDPDSMFNVEDVAYKQVQSGDVVLFYGSRLPHRTPFTGEHRLLILIDKFPC